MICFVFMIPLSISIPPMHYINILAYSILYLLFSYCFTTFMNVFRWSLKNNFPNYNAICLLKSATRKGGKYNYLKKRGSKKQNPHVVQRFKWWNTCGIDREVIGNWQYIGDVGI